MRKAVPLFIFTILLFFGATMHPLWGDEAETALFAKNILKYGVPKGWDGVNIMGINNAVVLNQDLINHTSPWLQYYLAAFSFKLFGVSSFTARLPFVAISVFSLLVFYFLVLKSFNNQRLAFLSSFAASLSVPFVLFLFQSRYYSLTVLSGLLMAVSSFGLMEKKYAPKILFIISSVLLFYSNYVVFAAFYVALAVAQTARLFLLNSNRIKIFLLHYLVSSIVVCVFTLPWFLLMKPFSTRGGIVFPNLWQLKDLLPEIIKEAIVPYNFNNGFPVLLLFPFLYLIWKKRKRLEELSSFLFFAVLVLVFLFVKTVFTITSVMDTVFVHVRYTMVIFPYLLLISVFLIKEIAGKQKILGVLLFLVYVFTNLLTLQKPRVFLAEFFEEYLSNDKTPSMAVSQYLNSNAKPNQTVFLSLDRDHEPLIFLLEKQLRFVNRVTLTNTRIFPKNRGIIPRYIYDFRQSPDWVVMYSKRGNDQSFMTFDYRSLPDDQFPKEEYEEIILPVFFSDLTRPEMDKRSFVKVTPDPNDQIFIYRKKAAGK